MTVGEIFAELLHNVEAHAPEWIGMNFDDQTDSDYDWEEE